jgi:DNA helicase II / ATP-dependent DNA helicase PcrA
MVAVLTQIVRPLDKRNLAVLIGAFNRVAGIECNPEQIIADAEASGHSYLASWCSAAAAKSVLLAFVGELVGAGANFRTVITKLIEALGGGVAGDETEIDFAEDRTAWIELTNDINRNVGRQLPLDQFLQELQLRSKEPSPKHGTVTLMTVHGAKGREFECVYLVGLAEDVLPSFQSQQKGDKSPEMEEERRNCFVAITRAKECLILSRANRYRGWQKVPSRFLVEMGLARAA